MSSERDAEQSDDLGSMGSMLRALADAPGGPGPLAAGQRVADKYEIVRVLGEGGMGVVYLARDTRLGRDVAIKVGTAVSEAALARAEREAQVLAKLTHPNVVTVYEVGEVGGRLFVAMEYMAAGTARRWVARAKRSVREVVALYAAAGDGLAAAHAAGIVHRDFKPDNVLVGEDDRPRVADFGLARETGGRDELGPADASGSDERTATGVALGTPAYMAPEQHASADVDAQADQFALCAALWEALHGVRPYGGSTREERLAAIRREEQAGTAAVPAHVTAALRRGLRADPAARWPSVAELVRELRRDPGARRRRIAIAGLAAVAAIGAVAVPVLVMRGGDVEDPCGGGAARAALTWSPARADAIGRTFAAADGSGVWTAIRPSLDEFDHAWIAAERDACQAIAPDDVRDKRLICVAQARASFASIVAMLAAGGAVVARAPALVDTLPELAGCDDVDELAAEATPPVGTGARDRIAVLSRRLADIRTQLSSQRTTETRASADALVAEARAIAWPRLVADALYVRARVIELAGDEAETRAAFEDCANAAVAAHADKLAANATAELVMTLAEHGHPDDALRWLQLAKAEAARLAVESPIVGNRIADAEATALEAAGRGAESLAARKRQVAFAARAWHDPMTAATSHLALAQGYRAAGQLDDAAREIALARSGLEAVAGPDAGGLLEVLDQSVIIAEAQGRLDDAERDGRRAVALGEKQHGADSREVAQSAANLGGVLIKRGKLDEAVAMTHRALAIYEAKAPDAVQTGEYELNTAVLASALGHLDDGRAIGERATATLERAWGKDNPDLATAYIQRGWTARAQKDLPRSEEALRHAVALADRGTSPTDPVNTRIELSYTLVAEHQAAAAVTAFAPVAAILARGQTEPRIAAEYHSAYADALWATGAHDKAIAEATASRDAWAALGDDFAAPRDAAVAWLRAHR